VVVPLAVGFILLRFRVFEAHEEPRHKKKRASAAKHPFQEPWRRGGEVERFFKKRKKKGGTQGMAS